jgi:hypothetical protein
MQQMQEMELKEQQVGNHSGSNLVSRKYLEARKKREASRGLAREHSAQQCTGSRCRF